MDKWVDDVKKEYAKKIAYQTGLRAASTADHDDGRDDDHATSGWRAWSRPSSSCSADRAAAPRLPLGPRADGAHDRPAHRRGGLRGRRRGARGRRREAARRARRPALPGLLPRAAARRSRARATSRRSRAASTRSSCAGTRTSSARSRRDTPGRVRRTGSGSSVEQEGREGVFHDVPDALPALLYARKVQRRAKAVGFEYPDVAGAVADLDDELRELKDEPASPPERPRAEELGDVLFAAVNVARRLNVDPELALRRASRPLPRARRERRAARRRRAARTGASCRSRSRTATSIAPRRQPNEPDRPRPRPPDPRLARQPDRRGRRARSSRARSAAPRSRRAPRPACTRPSSCATAAAAYGGKGVTQAVANVNGEIADGGARARRGRPARRSTGR